MGIGPQTFALYRQMKTRGLFDGIAEVMELGAQQAWCTDEQKVFDLFGAFGRPPPARTLLSKLANTENGGETAAREVYEGLGLGYTCIDLNGNFGALPIDINFDKAPKEHRGRYGLVTNFGTTEHLFDQKNAFEMIHDLTAVDGLMLHAVPFTVYLEHGFFNYQPNLFDALARYNALSALAINAD